ncbi:GTPase Era [Anaplasma capra]|uniref:GTPase Era n=1 Tax=Anaplasma capra TaxID=1562740 RepID=UPI0021D5AD94|nr:GTPase Era [Anaplasma capra]MCU7611526.1 GTPase Era [Anaplasma capra]MCU7612035.1 GTPase Era [Anaplasma capra]
MEYCSTGKCSLIAVVGATNAGKSTLINGLVGFKASIVTPKVHTTRVRMNAVRNDGDVQLVFTDTPGIFVPKTNLEKFLVKNAWMSIKGADVAILVFDARNYTWNQTVKVVTRVKNSNIPTVAVLNKTDLLQECQISEILAHIRSMHAFAGVFAVSALYGLGTEALLAYLRESAVDCPWLYPSTQRTDATVEFFVAEITREKLFFALRQELPYSLSVVTEKFEEKSRSVVVKQVIYVIKESQKAIVVGKNATLVKSISTSARAEMEQLLGKKVHLFLFVKVRKFWQDHLEECVGCV